MSSENKPRDIDYVFKLFSLSYVLITFIGLIYNFFYYRSFGIIITQYVDLGEVLTLFTPLLTNFFFVMVFFWIPITFIMRGFVNSLSDEARRNNFRKIWLFYLCIFLIVSLVAYIVSYWYPSSKRVAELFLAAGIAICAPGCLDMFFDYLSSLFKISIPKILSEIFILLVLLVSVTVKAVSTEIDKVNRRVFSKSYELTFKNGDAKVVTDSNVVFLGRTRNYIFIHELNSKSSRVINADDVKEVVIKSVQ